MLTTIIAYLPTLLVFALIFGLLVFVHEFGHFIVAKRSGVKVEEFGFGMPPRLWGKQVGETLYSLNWIPLGGFVKMLGQDDFDPKLKIEATKNPRSFLNKKAWQRLLILVAGVFMNFVLAWLLLAITYTIGAQPLAEGSSSFEKAIHYQEITISSLDTDSPAELGKLAVGDQILAINEQSFTKVPELQTFVKEHAGETLNFTVKRAEETLKFPIQNPTDGSGLGLGMLQKATLDTIKYSFWEAPRYALEDLYYLAKLTLKGLGDLFIKIVTQFKLTEEISGPIGIIQITHDVMRFGLIPILQFAAILSVSLGVVNILPFPALDGGRLLFVLVEIVRRKKHSAFLEGHIHFIGFLLLLALIIAVSYQDLVKLFG